MFDLEQAIAEWRKQMLATGIKTPVPLEELEIHLREEIERQMQSGMSGPDAFENAALRIGCAGALKTEFNRTDVKGRFETALPRFVLFGAILAFGWILTMGIHAFWNYEMSLAWRLAGFADIATIALSVVGWRWINRAFPLIPDKRIRTAIGIAFGCFGVIGMIVFMKFILPNFEFTEGQLTVVVLWGLTLMAGCGVLLAGLEEAARKHTTAAD